MCRANISIETSKVLRRNRKVGLAAEDAGVMRWSWPPCNRTPPRVKVASALRGPTSPLGSPRHCLLFAAADAAASFLLTAPGALT